MASLTLDPAPAAQPSDAGSGVNEGLSTTASGQRVTYCGVPAKGIYRHRQGHDRSHGVPLDSRHDLANLGSIAENRDDADGSRCQLALAILADFLGDTHRALRVYRAFARYIVTQTPVGRVWLMTESDVAEALATAESNSGLLWDEKRVLYIERASPGGPAAMRISRVIKSRKSQS
jgi:hypothetical protein